MIDLEKLKGVTLNDATFAELKAGFDDLTSQRDAARSESINGRKALKASNEAQTAALAEALEWAGVDSIDALRDLPGPKGAADAARQVDAKLKKLERDLGERNKAFDDLSGRHAAQVRESQIAEALEGHRFKTPADVRVLIERRVKADGDSLLFETDDGKLVPLKEGAAWFAKTRPDYVLAADAGGQGSGFKGTGGQGGSASKVGDFGGDKTARQAAIASKFPELAALR